jgi:hypothetical protein
MRKQINYKSLEELYSSAILAGGKPDCAIVSQKGIRRILRMLGRDRNYIRRFMRSLDRAIEHQKRMEDEEIK